MKWARETVSPLGTDRRRHGRLRQPIHGHHQHPVGASVPGPWPKELASIAGEFGSALVYVPSMRSGPAATREGRGSAILSTLPLSDPVGIELPWVAQRRVAVMATATALAGGAPRRLRFV